jgi:hypothetical protein
LHVFEVGSNDNRFVRRADDQLCQDLDKLALSVRLLPMLHRDSRLPQCQLNQRQIKPTKEILSRLRGRIASEC